MLTSEIIIFLSETLNSNRSPWFCHFTSLAVLVAIAIPVFTSQLEKSRESTDAANIRNEYAEIMVEILENPQTSITSNHTVTLMQAQNSWQNK